MAETTKTQKPTSDPKTHTVTAPNEVGNVAEAVPQGGALDLGLFRAPNNQNKRQQTATMLQMQKLVGNQSVLRMIQAQQASRVNSSPTTAEAVQGEDDLLLPAAHIDVADPQVHGTEHKPEATAHTVERKPAPRHHTNTPQMAENTLQREGMGEEAAEFEELSTLLSPEADLGQLGGDNPATPPSAPAIRPSSDNAIQRISISDLDPTAIINQVRGFINAGEGAEGNAESTTQTQAENVKERAQQAGQTLETQTQTAAGQSETMQQQAQTQQQQVQTEATQGQTQVSTAGTQAASQLSSVGAAVRPALSLANQINGSGAASAAASQIGGLGQPLTASPEAMNAVGNRVSQAVSQGVAADGRAGWNCDQAEVLAIAANMGKAAIEPLIRAADDLTGGGATALIEFAGEVGAKLRQTATEVMNSVRELGSAIATRVEDLTRPLVDAVRAGMQAVSDAYNAAKNFVTEQWQSLQRAFVEGWNTLRQSATQWVNQQIASARATIQNAIDRASSIISSAGSALRELLPDWVVEGIDSLRETLSSVQETIRQGIDEAVEYAGELKDQAVAGARDLADGALQTATEAYRDAQQMKDQVVEGIRDAGRAAVDMIPQPIRDAASSAADFVGEQVDSVRAAANEVLQDVSGAVCKPINEIAGPCLDRYLPYNETTTSSVSVASSQSVTVPLQEIGIPASAEIGEGSSLTISRTGATTYTLKVVGDSSIMLTENASEASFSADVDLPSGQNAKGADIWRQLTSGGAPSTPAAPAAPQTQGGQGQQGTNGAGGGAGSGSSIKAKGGLKRSLAVTYTFNVSDSTCDLASLAGVLAGYGATGALASIAPPPFRNLISGAGAMATGAAANNYITNITMTNALAGEVKGSAGGADLTGTAEVSQAMSLDRNDQGELVPTTIYTVQIAGQIAGKLSLGGLMEAGGSLGAQGSLALTLGYNNGNITPQKVEAAIEATLAMNGFSVSQLPLQYIPGDAPAAITQRLEMLRRLGVNGSIKAELKYTVAGLENLVNALRNYFDTAPIESITWGGVMDIVGDQFASRSVTVTPEFSVKLTETSRVGVSVSGTVSQGGATIAGSASASASHNVVHTLYSMGGGSTPTPTPDTPVVPPPTPTPDTPVVPPGPTPTPQDPVHPEPREPVPGPVRPGPQNGNGGGGTPPTHRNPLDMTVEEFEASPEAQRELYDMAVATRARQQAFANAILADTRRPGSATSILKRDDFDEFVAGVIEKCRRKRYARIGQMDDIVRGRFNMDLGPDVEAVAIAMQNQQEFPVTVVERPRRPNEHGFGYPRWHVVVRDTSGITHEWQIGTQAVTDVYETRGITIPEAVGDLPPGMHNDIHDIEYDILRRIQTDHPDIAEGVGIPAFRHEVDLVSARAGTEGKNMGDIQERIGELHGRCSVILQTLVDRHGPDIIRKYFKHSGTHDDPE